MGAGLIDNRLNVCSVFSMEQQSIGIHSQRQDQRTGELEVEGLAERFGESVRWSARRLEACAQWEIDFPSGQFVGPDGLEREQLVFESDPPLSDVIRAELKRARLS